MPLRVGYVPEHFASPLLQYAADDQGKTLVLTPFPGGTGAMTAALGNNEIDVAVTRALTDALIAGIAKGSHAYKLVGSYVQTSLNWAVVTGKNSKFQSIEDIRGTKIGISRIGRLTMAAVMAMQSDWKTPDGKVEIPEFQVNNDLKGLNASVNDGSTSAFLWEWFTTKPYADSGEVRFIGSVLTPWPSWLIAAHPSPDRADPGVLRSFLGRLTEYVRKFDEPREREQADVDFIRKHFGYEEHDIREWLKTVRWVEDCSAISGKVIVDTLNILNEAGVVQRPLDGFKVEDFINHDVARII
ncbi:hypothetical protein RhiJN_03078 [Ceratobasidium sp. AG-Ba]|nr:hypothetical protein RhiJN_03078 [Ceratobasidium sp. AG-Ba]QRW03964.1 hypothetical protein RhiLY_02963 [Ceratobasidium sp. AG-Ba]